MRVTAVAALAGELDEASPGRADWDRRLLYQALVRWGGGRVKPARARMRWRDALGRACRALSVAGRPLPGWRASAAGRWLRDIAQVQRFAVDDDVEVLYGNIVFPVTAPPRPTVWSTQGVLDARPGIWFPEESARTHARMITRSAATQCWSQLGLAGIVERQPHVDTNKLHVIPPLLYIDLPDPWPRDGTDVVALFVGAFGLLKGIDVVVEAMREVGPGLRLEVICNDTPPADLPAAITWLGPRPRPEVLARLRSADIHLFPSTTESFGIAAVEAMAAGVPQIIDAGGVPAELVGPGGIAVDGRSPASVAAALTSLAADRQRREELGRLGAARYRERFSPEAVGPQLEALFDSV